MKKLNIGFVSTRLAGLDGVSLETAKWVKVCERLGHTCFYFAGELDTPKERSFLTPLAHFSDDKIKGNHDLAFIEKGDAKEILQQVSELSKPLQESLLEFCKKFKIDLLVPQNTLTIPMNIPLGVAITNALFDSGLPAIAHHHDFYWERPRFADSPVSSTLDQFFPPVLQTLQHVVINSAAQEDLKNRKSVQATVIPNVMDFENPPSIDLEGGKRFRQEIGVEEDRLLILQPTRIVKRKGIEYAIDLCAALKDRNPALVISHASGDEGDSYLAEIKSYAQKKSVELLVASERLKSPDSYEQHQLLIDAYIAADFVTFPSTYEGFGNALLETIYYRKPVLVNRYKVFKEDIEGAGFKFAVIDHKLDAKAVAEVEKCLDDSRYYKNVVDHNYDVALENFSFKVVERHLVKIMESMNVV